MGTSSTPTKRLMTPSRRALLTGAGASVAAVAMPQIVAADDRRTEILRKLREVGALKFGDPIPAWLDKPNGWGGLLSALCRDAADLIEETPQADTVEYAVEWRIGPNGWYYK